MARTALLIAAALSMIPSLAAAQPVEIDAELAEAGAAVDPGAEDEEGYAEDGEEEDYGDVEFCGGDDESIVDLAYYELEEGRLTQAREMLVTALREGEVDEWQRGSALATLAEVQLRMRQYRAAILNYRKALQVDPDNLPANVRIGLATALHLRGASASAHALAAEVRDEVCDDRWSMVECFAANALLARSSRDASEIEAATESLSALRAAHPDRATSFDEVEARLERRRARAGADHS